MSEDIKLPFKIYSSSGTGFIAGGHHTKSMEMIEVTDGVAEIRIGTELVTVCRGDFVCVPPTLVYRITASEGEASVRALVFKPQFANSLFKSFVLRKRIVLARRSKNHWRRKWFRRQKYSYC